MHLFKADGRRPRARAKHKLAGAIVLLSLISISLVQKGELIKSHRGKCKPRRDNLDAAIRLEEKASINHG